MLGPAASSNRTITNPPPYLAGTHCARYSESRLLNRSLKTAKIRAPGDHVADPAARVGHVARVPRNDVNVQVEDRLPGRPPDVDPDVVAVGCMRRLDRRLRDIHRFQQLPPLLAGSPRTSSRRAGASRAARARPTPGTHAPSSPASRHSADRHAVIGRRAVRTVWQTGQPCCQIRPAAPLPAFRVPCDASRVRIRGSNPAARTGPATRVRAASPMVCAAGSRRCGPAGGRGLGHVRSVRRTPLFF